jgi:hypothetical protein
MNLAAAAGECNGAAPGSIPAPFVRLGLGCGGDSGSRAANAAAPKNLNASVMENAGIYSAR